MAAAEEVLSAEPAALVVDYVAVADLDGRPWPRGAGRDHAAHRDVPERPHRPRVMRPGTHRAREAGSFARYASADSSDEELGSPGPSFVVSVSHRITRWRSRRAVGGQWHNVAHEHDARRRPDKVGLIELAALKRDGTPIVMVTAYDFPSAKLADEAGVDIVFTGDSAANNVLGYADTTPISMDEMVMLGAAARRGTHRAFFMIDMPLGAFQVSDEDAVRHAVRLVKETGAEAVKIEGGGAMVSRARAIVAAGIPTMGHLGLTPQSATMLGGYKAQGRTAAKARQLFADALSLQAAGCRDRAGGGSGARGGADHAGAAHPDHRHRRGRAVRRTGAGLARPAGHQHRADRQVRQALRLGGR